MIRRPPRSTLFPTRRSSDLDRAGALRNRGHRAPRRARAAGGGRHRGGPARGRTRSSRDRKSTRLNSSHSQISYAVFCLKKKKKKKKKNKVDNKITNAQKKTQ